jgi:hypothetical protein
MAFFAANRVKVSTVTTGTSDFVVGAATSAAFRSFAGASVPDGATVHYTAFTTGEFECGEGVYTSGTTTLARTTIFASSNSGNKVSFVSGPTIIIAPLAEEAYTSYASFVPATDDGHALGTTSLKWGDLFLASGGVINWNSGDVTVTHSANALAFAGVTSGYTFDDEIKPASNDGAALGTTALGWSDAFFADGGVLNWGNGGATVTHTAASGSLTLALDPANGLAGTNFTLTMDGAEALKFFTTDPFGFGQQSVIFKFADGGGASRIIAQLTDDSFHAAQFDGYRISANPAANDYLTAFYGIGKTSTQDDAFYGGMLVAIKDPIDATATGRLEFEVMSSGSTVNPLSIDDDGLKFFGGSNALAVYEEGTFTPTLTTSGTDFDAVTYDALTAGRYTKIGNVVHFQAFVQTDSVTVGSATGFVRVGGLPFTAISATGGTVDGSSPVAIAFAADWAGEEPMHANVQGGQTEIVLYYRSAVDGNDTPTALADVGTGTNDNQIMVGGTYIAA